AALLSGRAARGDVALRNRGWTARTREVGEPRGGRALHARARRRRRRARPRTERGVERLGGRRPGAAPPERVRRRRTGARRGAEDRPRPARERPSDGPRGQAPPGLGSLPRGDRVVRPGARGGGVTRRRRGAPPLPPRL